MKAQSILELGIATEFAIAKSLAETLNKIEKGVYGCRHHCDGVQTSSQLHMLTPSPMVFWVARRPVCGQYLEFINNIAGGAQVAIT
jgi:hypothetical protein